MHLGQTPSEPLWSARNSGWPSVLQRKCASHCLPVAGIRSHVSTQCKMRESVPVYDRSWYTYGWCTSTYGCCTSWSWNRSAWCARYLYIAPGRRLPTRTPSTAHFLNMPFSPFWQLSKMKWTSPGSGVQQQRVLPKARHAMSTCSPPKRPYQWKQLWASRQRAVLPRIVAQERFVICSSMLCWKRSWTVCTLCTISSIVGGTRIPATCSSIRSRRRSWGISLLAMFSVVRLLCNNLFLIHSALFETFLRKRMPTSTVSSTKGRTVSPICSSIRSEWRGGPTTFDVETSTEEVVEKCGFNKPRNHGWLEDLLVRCRCHQMQKKNRVWSLEQERTRWRQVLASHVGMLAHELHFRQYAPEVPRGRKAQSQGRWRSSSARTHEQGQEQVCQLSSALESPSRSNTSLLVATTSVPFVHGAVGRSTCDMARRPLGSRKGWHKQG